MNFESIFEEQHYVTGFCIASPADYLLEHISGPWLADAWRKLESVLGSHRGIARPEGFCWGWVNGGCSWPGVVNGTGLQEVGWFSTQLDRQSEARIRRLHDEVAFLSEEEPRIRLQSGSRGIHVGSSAPHDGLLGLQLAEYVVVGDPHELICEESSSSYGASLAEAVRQQSAHETERVLDHARTRMSSAGFRLTCRAFRAFLSNCVHDCCDDVRDAMLDRIPVR